VLSRFGELELSAEQWPIAHHHIYVQIRLASFDPFNSAKIRPAQPRSTAEVYSGLHCYYPQSAQSCSVLPSPAQSCSVLGSHFQDLSNFPAVQIPTLCELLGSSSSGNPNARHDSFRMESGICD
jgi:hypothetical protein